MNKLFIPFVLGTAREGRKSENAARYAYAELQKREDVETVFVDVRDYLFGYTGAETEARGKWKEIASKADGFVIVAPEYNHGYPGELKLLLDSLYDGEYKRKAFALCGVSVGTIGGARMVENLIPVIVDLYAITTRNSVCFAEIGKLFDATGKITDDSYAKKLSGLFDELVDLTKTLKLGRA